MKVLRDGTPEKMQAQVARYERLLNGVASSTNVLLTQLDYCQSMSQALAILGEATQVDRIYVFEVHSHPETKEPAMSQRWEWAALGIPSELGNPELQNISFSEYCPRWYDELSRRHPLHGLVQGFPTTEKEILEAQGILSILVIPIQIQGDLWGFVGFDQCQTAYEWTTVEISTLWAIAGSIGGKIARHLTEQSLQELNHTLEQRVEQRTQALSIANTELAAAMTLLKETQSQLVQTEKMSSLGQLVAGIAHEINNPANFIYGNLGHAQRYTEELLNLVKLYQHEYPIVTPTIEAALSDIDFTFLKKDFSLLIRSTREGVERIMYIVRSLRNFSRLDESTYKLIDIHQGIDSTLNFLQHRLQPKDNTTGITVIKQFDEQLPMVECFPSSLNQALMNVLVNAIDVLEEKSPQAQEEQPNKIEIRTELLRPSVLNTLPCNRVLIEVTDNGSGMSAVVQEKMFDPFFTNKPVGKGTGLGLSIAHQIVVQAHGGEITCQTALGKGTTFKIYLPMQQKRGLSSNGCCWRSQNGA